ncbi:hypothetical protein [Legionella yabuuchiae]|uniref:hypothetical protein n=1 Tax=Legionella yabuuchiae TaxID=376727 RepID=UPI0010553C6A|nr:hypothetical protein [Legionella yabuuchiae]
MLLELLAAHQAYKSIYRPGKYSTLKTPEEQQAIIAEFSKSMGFGKGMEGAELFTQYLEKRQSSIQDIRDKTLKELSKDIKEDNSNQNALRKEIESITKPDPSFLKEQQAYETQIAALNRKINAADGSLNIYELQQTVKRLEQEASNALAAQNKKDLEKLTKLFKDPDNRNQLAKLLNIASTDNQSDKKIDAAIEKITDSFKSSQSTYTKAAIEPLANSHREILNQIESENSRIFALAGLYNKNEAIKAYIDQLYEKNRKSPGAGVTIQIGDEDGSSALFKGIKIEDLPVLETQTGLNINKHGNGEFSIQMPRPLFSTAYHRGWNSKMKEDLQSLALMVRASGYDTITMDIDHPDPERCMKLAAEAYEACRKSGFESKNITLKINGVEKKIDEVFKGRNDRYKAIEERAQFLKTQKETLTPKVSAQRTNQIKEDLMGMKKESSTEQPSAETPPIHQAAP